jgi:hypothetical protein
VRDLETYLANTEDSLDRSAIAARVLALKMIKN